MKGMNRTCVFSLHVEYDVSPYTLPLGIKMQGYLFKKSDKNKKWKCLYFVLICSDGNTGGGGGGTGGSGDTHLCFYDNPKVSTISYFTIP